MSALSQNGLFPIPKEMEHLFLVTWEVPSLPLHITCPPLMTWPHSDPCYNVTTLPKSQDSPLNSLFPYCCWVIQSLLEPNKTPSAAQCLTVFPVTSYIERRTTKDNFYNIPDIQKQSNYILIL